MEVVKVMEPVRTRLGRSKFGGSQTLLIISSLAGGLLLAATFGAIVATTQYRNSPILAFTVFTLTLLPVGSVAAWGILVDRSSIRGFAKSPEESIENQWYNQAAQDTFHLSLVLVGVLGVISIFHDFSFSGSSLAIYLGLLLMATFAISYNFRKWRES